MPYEYNKKITPFSQQLRRNMTKEEKHLWYDFLKKLPATVNRQKVIGEYVVDFYIHSSMIAIELDGIQHKTREHIISDKERDAYLNSLGIKVLRYDNERIKNDFAFVCQDILEHIKAKKCN